MLDQTLQGNLEAVSVAFAIVVAAAADRQTVTLE